MSCGGINEINKYLSFSTLLILTTSDTWFLSGACSLIYVQLTRVRAIIAKALLCHFVLHSILLTVNNPSNDLIHILYLYLTSHWKTMDLRVKLSIFYIVKECKKYNQWAIRMYHILIKLYNCRDCYPNDQQSCWVIQFLISTNVARSS